MRTYVINLARSVDRRRHITSELKKTGVDYEIITAVDGRDLDLTDVSIVDPSLSDRTQFLASSVGCALSHLSVYQRIIADGIDVALVLEDDVTLPRDLGSLADTVADQLTGAEVALLSCDSFEVIKVSPKGAIRLQKDRQIALPIDVSQLRSTGAYIVTREACERLTKMILPVKVNADYWWHFYREGALDRVRCVVPLPVDKSPRLISTMGSYALGSGLIGRVAWSLVRHKVPILHQVLCYRRRRIYRRWSRWQFVDVPFSEKPSRLEQADA